MDASGKTSAIISLSLWISLSVFVFCFWFWFWFRRSFVKFICCCATLAVGYFKFRQVKEYFKGCVLRFHISLYVFYLYHKLQGCSGFDQAEEDHASFSTLLSFRFFSFILFFLACVIYSYILFTEHEFTARKKNVFYIYYITL